MIYNKSGEGKPSNTEMAVLRFVQRALNNEPVLIYGTGQQRRCFCYVEDFVDAIIALCNCEQAAGKVYKIS